MYDTLLQLPLFQGMSRTELSEVVEHVKLHFHKYEMGETLFCQGDRCDQLVFLLSGELSAETVAPSGLFSLMEVCDKPQAIELYSLFGKCPSYGATYVARTEVSVLTIDKCYIYGVFDKYEVFCMNLYNLLSNRVAQQRESVWSVSPQHIEGRLAHFVRTLCSVPYGIKVLRVKMTDLALLLDDTRLNVSGVLNKWKDEGLVEMHRMEYVFNKIENLP